MGLPYIGEVNEFVVGSLLYSTLLPSKPPPPSFGGDFFSAQNVKGAFVHAPSVSKALLVLVLNIFLVIFLFP